LVNIWQSYRQEETVLFFDSWGTLSNNKLCGRPPQYAPVTSDLQSGVRFM